MTSSAGYVLVQVIQKVVTKHEKILLGEKSVRENEEGTRGG
jgi:hypothetical protein